MIKLCGLKDRFLYQNIEINPLLTSWSFHYFRIDYNLVKILTGMTSHFTKISAKFFFKNFTPKKIRNHKSTQIERISMTCKK